MASHIVDIFEVLRTRCFDKLPADMGINHVELSDPYTVGPELRTGRALNAIIVAPMEPTVNPADAAQMTKRVELPLLIYFIFKRGNVTFRDVIERYVDPLHNVLEQYELRRLGGVQFYGRANNPGERGKLVARVVNFRVDEPNLFPPDNDDLYPLGLACFTIPVQVNYIKVMDTDNQQE